MIGRTNVVGNGATLEISGVAGNAVVISKDGISKTKVFDTNGIARFVGLSDGEWVITMYDNEQSATRKQQIITGYYTTISFFAATINVTYPAGSTCTATDGVTTLTASDTSGTWVCVVPNAGTWTVTTTDGENEKSIDVTITTDGQLEKVEIAYWNGELYDAGNQYSSITGGWTSDETSGAPAITYGTDSMTITATAAGANKKVRTGKKIDMSGWSALTFEGTHENAGVYNLMGLLDDGKNSVDSVILRDGHSLDISSLTGEYYVYFQVRDASRTTVVTKLYLT